jgi:hypothetical protein
VSLLSDGENLLPHPLESRPNPTRTRAEAPGTTEGQHHAAGKESVTEDLLRQLQEYLKKARVNPKLRFSA